MQPPLSQLLRDATRDAHERLHVHDGFAAVKDGSIGLRSYGRLLTRLYGFYRPYERSTAIGCERSQWLRQDLLALGLDRRALGRVPSCPFVPRLETADRRLGSLYVIEGSALGGLELERSLDRLLGSGTTAGRRFFKGRGAGTKPAWTAYLEQLVAASTERHATATIIAAATETFAAFETWLSGWDTALDEDPLPTD